MSKSKHRKKHLTQLLKFKTKQKQMSEQKQSNGIPQMPEVRNVPVWASDAEIVLTGFEWEAIQNALVQVQIAQQAAQSVMSRNIISGVVKMDFEKLNPQTLQYEPMADADKKQHQEAFAKMIEGIKAQIEKQSEPQQAVEAEDGRANEAVSAIVSATGEPIAKEQAKVIQMDQKG